MLFRAPAGGLKNVNGLLELGELALQLPPLALGKSVLCEPPAQVVFVDLFEHPGHEIVADAFDKKSVDLLRDAIEKVPAYAVTVGMNGHLEKRKENDSSGGL